MFHDQSECVQINVMIRKYRPSQVMVFFANLKRAHKYRCERPNNGVTLKT